MVNRRDGRSDGRVLFRGELLGAHLLRFLGLRQRTRWAFVAAQPLSGPNNKRAGEGWSKVTSHKGQR